MSINPGNTVFPFKSITSASEGQSVDPEGKTAFILFRSNTIDPLNIGFPVPSNIRPPVRTKVLSGPLRTFGSAGTRRGSSETTILSSSHSFFN